MKDYKNILEGVVNIINTTEKSDIGFVNICNYIDDNCPELKESEDEKIRKDIISLVDEFWAKIGSINPEFTTHDKMIAWLEKQGEQKPVKCPEYCVMSNCSNCPLYREKRSADWGQWEEDAFRSIFTDVKIARMNTVNSLPENLKEDERKQMNKVLEFLIRLKVNYNPVWSEDDEEHIESILKRLDGMCKKGATFTKTCFAVNQDMDWLKSLRPQNTWKPNDEQMEALKSCVGKTWFDIDALRELLEQLKKL